MHIIPQNTLAGYIFGLCEEFVGQIHGKERIEFLDKPLVSAHVGLQSFHILRNIERIVPRVTFEEAFAVRAQRVEILFPRTVAVTCAGQTQILVESVAVVQRAFFVGVGDLCLAHIFGRVVDRPVVEYSSVFDAPVGFLSNGT